MTLENKIEAILFFKGEPINLKKLEGILKVPVEEILLALSNLKNNLANRGIVLLEKEKEYTLGTAPELSELIENLQKEELNKDLSKSALETLSIILYKNGAHRAYIDYVRGVNSSFTLRALSVRGLIEKTIDPKDSRKNLYKPTFELMSYLGIKELRELPNFESTLDNLNKEEINFEELKKEDATN